MGRREDMERLSREGKSLREIARLYGISHQAVWSALNPRPRWHSPLIYAYTEQVLTQLRGEFPSADGLPALVKWAVNWTKSLGQSSDPATIVAICRSRLPPAGRHQPRRRAPSLHTLPPGCSASAILLTGVGIQELGINGRGASAKVYSQREVEVAIPFFGGPEFMGLYQALDRPSYLRPIYQRLRSLQGQRWNNESQLSHAIALTLADLKLEGPREPGSDFVIHLDTPVLLEAKVRGPALLRNVAQLMTYMYEEHVQWGLLVKATPNSLLLKALRRQA